MKTLFTILKKPSEGSLLQSADVENNPRRVLSVKCICLILPLLFLVPFVNAQELGLQFGKSISNFKFSDSEGSKLKGLEKDDNFFMSVDYREMIFAEKFKGRLFADAGLGYYRYGSSGSDAILNNHYTWQVTYIGINLGLDYYLYKIGSFMLYAKIAASPEFLIHGTQTLNNRVYNLVGEEDFESPIFFFRGGLGGQFIISDKASVFIQYMGGQSFNFNGSSEKLNIISHNLGFGLLFHVVDEPFQTEWRGRLKKAKPPKN